MGANASGRSIGTATVANQSEGKKKEDLRKKSLTDYKTAYTLI